jgi:mono/diheme cytochrome c family protein
MTVSASTRDAAVVFARFCSNCHQIQGEGGTSAPALDRVGGEHDAKWLRDWISDPTMIKPESNMPAFGERLTPEQMDAIVADLAARK